MASALPPAVPGWAARAASCVRGALRASHSAPRLLQNDLFFAWAPHIGCEPKTHEDDADYSEIMELAVLLRDTPDETLEDVLEERFVLDPFLKLMAVMTFSGAFDQRTICGLQRLSLYDKANIRIHHCSHNLGAIFVRSREISDFSFQIRIDFSFH